MKKKHANKFTFLDSNSVKVTSSKNGTHINIIFSDKSMLSLPKLFLKTIILSADKKERALQKTNEAA